jgi:dipeptidyl aminopeptidase/acylaminoacyl peptidase
LYKPNLKQEVQLYQGPVCIMHPQKDRFIPVNNSEQMVKALNRNNVELSVIPNETHTLTNDFHLKVPVMFLHKALERYRAD